MSAIAITVITAAAVLPAFMGLRLLPIWPGRNQGCDAYNILLCAEAVRRDKSLPPRVPGLFLLESEVQWYPPGFFVLCALVPERWLRRYHWLFNQAVDLANAALIFAVVAITASPAAGAAAVLVYAMMAGLVQEFATLTTRPLGLLVLNLLILSGFLAGQNSAYLPLALLCGVMLVYSHKLSAQQAWFTLPTLAAATGSWMWAALLPALYAAAFLIWPRGFREIGAGHWAIVKFWHRQWPLLGAHAVRQSPLYCDTVTRTDFYAAWPGGAPLRFAKETLHQNYFVLPAVAALATGEAATPFSATLGVWMISVYVWAAAIHLMPALRGIGLGRQYVKFALLPSLALAGEGAAQDSSPVVLAALALALALTARQYVLVAREMHRAAIAGANVPSADLAPLLADLAADTAARVMALPVQLCDLVAHAARRPVYWGTHAQVFDDRLAAFFPVLLRKIEEYAAESGLTRLLLDTSYASPRELGLDPAALLRQSGRYALYRLGTADKGPAAGLRAELQTA